MPTKGMLFFGSSWRNLSVASLFTIATEPEDLNRLFQFVFKRNRAIVTIGLGSRSPAILVCFNGRRSSFGLLHLLKRLLIPTIRLVRSDQQPSAVGALILQPVDRQVGMSYGRSHRVCDSFMIKRWITYSFGSIHDNELLTSVSEFIPIPEHRNSLDPIGNHTTAIHSCTITGCTISILR